MAGKIEIRCNDCGHEARVPEAFKGKKVRCLRCRAKLRVPGGDGDSPEESQRPRRGDRPLGDTAGGGAKVRREVQQSIREVLGDYEHAIEGTGRGFDVDLRGCAFGLARTLVEDLLQAPGIRDVKLSGGTGECRLTITIEGAAFDPDDSFADDDDDTELFVRPGSGALAADPPSERRSAEGKSAPPPERKAPRGEDPRVSASASRRKDSPESSSRGRSDAPRSEQSRAEKPAAEAPAPAGSSDDLDRKTAEAERLMDAGDLKRAADQLEKVVALDKNHVQAVQSLGETYARMGDHERSRRAFKHLSKLMPDDPEPLILHAAASVQCNRLEDARVSLSDAIKLDPENARAYKYAAVLYDRLGDPDRSRKFRATYERLKAATSRGSSADPRASRRSRERRGSSGGDEL